MIRSRIHLMKNAIPRPAQALHCLTISFPKFPGFCKKILAAYLCTVSFSSLVAISQNCSCPAFSALESEEIMDEVLLKNRVSQLQTSTNPLCKANSSEWLAEYYLAEQNFDSSLVYFQKAEALFINSGCGDSLLINTYKYRAQLHYSQGDFARSQEYCFKYLKCAESANNHFEGANANTMIAQIFNQTNQADKGIIYTRKAALLLEKIEKPAQQINILFKLAKRYLWHYQDTKATSSLDSSEMYSVRVLSLIKSSRQFELIAPAYNNLQAIAYEKGDFPKAIELLDSSFVYTTKDDIAGLGTNYFDKADLYLEMKQYEEALRMSDSCLHYRKLDGNPAFVAEAYQLISRIHLLSNNYKSAYEFKELARAINDSISNVEKTKEVTELERKYSQAKNEKTISELNQAQEISSLNIKLLSAGIIGSFLVIMLVIVFFRQSVLKNKQVQLEAEQRLNRARMNPHFFFNTLSSLQTSALKDKDPARLADLLAMYAKIMRSTLESTYEDLVSVEKEVEYLQMYLRLQQFRNNGNFTYTIDVADDLETSEMQIPGMIIQPFVENAIEHGFANPDRKGEIVIRFAQTNNMLQVAIIDNGAGLTSSVSTKTHKSRATEITRDRLFLLNKKHKSNATFEIKSNPGNAGTTVFITLPILY